MKSCTVLAAQVQVRSVVTIEAARDGSLPDPWREPPSGFATLRVVERRVRIEEEQQIDL